MTTDVIYSIDLEVRALSGDENFSYSTTESIDSFPETRLNIVKDDINYDAGLVQGDTNNQDIDISSPSSLGGAYSYSSNDARILIDSNGVTTREPHDGDFENFEARMTIHSTLSGDKKFDFYSVKNGGNPYEEFKGFESGTLGEHVYNQILGLISGLTPHLDSTQKYWLSNNGDIDAPAAVRNTGCFVAPLGLFGMTCMKGTWNAGQAPLTLVTSRHALSANHFGAVIGERVVFQREDGTFQEVTVQSKNKIDGSDIGIIYFDEPVTGIPVFKVMPADFEKLYVPSLTERDIDNELAMLLSITKLYHDFEGTAGDWTTIHAHRTIQYLEPTETDADKIWLTPVSSFLTEPKTWESNDPNMTGGDSGAPSFVPINGEAVLIWHAYTVTTEPLLSQYINEINAIMNTQAGTVADYALIHPDLSEFVSY